MNKKFVGRLAILLSLFISCNFIFINQASARSGCCSHHGGVCGCGCCDGTSLSKTCAPYYPECSDENSIPIKSAPPRQIVSTPKPTVKPAVRPTVKPTLKSTPIPVKCSDISDSICPNKCTAGNDIDCCGKKSGYSWHENYGCYPASDSYCSETKDNSCSAMCTAGNDFDCCLKQSGYTWYENWGCYKSK